MTIVYRAKARCLVGSLREPGDVFRWERFDTCPPHLEEVAEDSDMGVGEPAPSGGVTRKTKGKASGITPADMGVGEPTPSGGVDSTTMINQ